MQWLEGQEPASVIYVSFGSLATVSGGQLLEIAQGLEASQQPFLWVLREDLVEGEKAEFSNFLKSFREATKDRGYIAPWVAQTSVLAHKAVGAFLSHCGWNSTLESIAAGVPLVAMPVFADQLVNAFYATQVWGNALRLDRDEQAGLVTCDEVARKVRSVLQGQGGAAVRTRAAELKMAARTAVLPGGSSHSAMANSVHHIALRKLPQQDYCDFK